jgi:alpha-tubulin suppressor-like RCC1 family protein
MKSSFAAAVVVATSIFLASFGAGAASADIANPQLSGGYFNTCAISAGDRVYCWGSNGSQQNGYGPGNKSTYATRPYPARGVPFTPVGISVGYNAACVMQSYGTIGCWGRNTAGALGPESIGQKVPGFRPVAGLLSPWVTPSNVAVGTDHFCFRDNNQTVKCMGQGLLGQLGNGANAASSVVVQAAVITGESAATQARSVATGRNHSCALLANKNVKCWGVNNFRQLGTPANSAASVNSPVDVPGLSNDINELASKWDHTCAEHADDTISCWGADSYGQLGDGTVAPFKGAVTVKGISNSRQVSTGARHTCALVAGGVVKCWGSNAYGQLGNGTSTTSSSPVSVIGLPRPATEITAGGYHSCARLDNGQYWCWGRNNRGQLGNGLLADNGTPQLVGALGGIHFSGVSIKKSTAHQSLRVSMVVLPQVGGKIERRCATTANVTLTVVQDGQTRVFRQQKRRLRPSGDTKCVARFSWVPVSQSLTPSTVTIAGSFNGNAALPRATFSQTYNMP